MRALISCLVFFKLVPRKDKDKLDKLNDLVSEEDNRFALNLFALIFQILSMMMRFFGVMIRSHCCSSEHSRFLLPHF